MSLKTKLLIVLVACIGFVLSLFFYFAVRITSLEGPTSYVIGLYVGGVIAVLFYLIFSGSTISIAAVVDEDALLLVKQAGEESWGLPAGHVEPGESLIEAVKREVKEETGAEIEITGIQGIYTVTKGPTMLSLGIVFIARRSTIMPLSPSTSDVEEVRWFTRQEVKRLLEKENLLYKPSFNRRTIRDWLERKSFSLEVLDEITINLGR